MAAALALVLLAVVAGYARAEGGTCSADGTCSLPQLPPDKLWCEEQGARFSQSIGKLAKVAVQLHESGKMREAANAYTYLLCLRPKGPGIAHNLLQALMELNQSPEALKVATYILDEIGHDHAAATAYHNLRDELGIKAEIPSSSIEFDEEHQNMDDNGLNWPDEGIWWKTLKPWIRPPERRIKPQFKGVKAEDMFNQYVERHKRAFLALRDRREDPDSLRFVVVGPGSGFGNRQMVIVSAYLYALLSGRVLLVDWVSSTGQAFGDVGELYENPDGLNLSYGSARRLWPTWSGWGNHSMLLFDNTHYYSAEWSVDELACRDVRKEHEHDRVVSILTDQYLASFLMTNPHYKGIIARLGDGGDLYGSLFRKLMRPVPYIRNIVNKFVAKKFKGYYIIGIQARYGVGQFFLKEDLAEFWHCARAMARQRPLSQQNKIRFFLATDDPKIIRTAKRALGRLLVYYKTPRGNDLEGKVGWYGAAVDNFLLSECDDLIITSTSTFGYVAAARKGLAPMTMSGMFRRCVRPLTSQPQNTAHMAIKRTSCFDPEKSLRAEEDMLCANLGSNHACNSPSAFKMAEIMQRKKLVRELNFQMHKNGDPAMPTIVARCLNAIAKKGLKQWTKTRSFDRHMEKGNVFSERHEFLRARRQYGCASALAFLSGDREQRLKAYMELARASAAVSKDAKLDLSTTLHMFWRAIREDYNSSIMLNQAQLLQHYKGVPKVSVVATLFRQALHRLADGPQLKDNMEFIAMCYYKLKALLVRSGRGGDAEALPSEFPQIAALLERAKIDEKRAAKAFMFRW